MYFDLASMFNIPLYRLLDEMPYEEFLGWMSYLDMRPIGWREDLRVYKLLQAQGVKADADKVFSSIAQMHKSEATRQDEIAAGMLEVTSFQRSQMFNRMMGAKGGEVIDYDKLKR